MFDPAQSVANLVLEHSECAPVFQKHRIDYCCKGNVSVTAAALDRGLALSELTRDLNLTIRGRREASADPRALSTQALVDHIQKKHHAYLRTALPFVVGLGAKVSRVHGDHNPKLRDVAKCIDELSAALLPHLDEEDNILFPQLVAADSKPAHSAEEEARIAPLMHAMLEEHLAVGATLERLRDAADNFEPPSWACTSYRTLMTELIQLEADTLAHVHLENHVLRPRFHAPTRA